MKCINCDIELTGKRRKFCSVECANKYRKKESNKYREELIKFHGGKCQKCGYDKCIGALHFHHMNPKNKLFKLSRALLKGHSKREIYEESLKCILLCANCHSEEHYEESP